MYSTFDVANFRVPAQGGIPFPSEGNIFLSGGIVAFDVVNGSTVRNNTVANAGFGVFVSNGDIITPPVEPPSNPDGSKFTGNRLNDNFVGLFIAGSDNVFYGNRARTNVAGIVVVEGENNLFHANDARFNHEIDCDDETTGTGDADTANWWTNEAEGRYNFGEYNDPEEICIPTFFPF